MPPELGAHFATRRTCSGCRPTCGAATTSPSRRFYQGNDHWLLSPDPGSGRLSDAQLRAGTTTQVAPDQELRQLTSTGPRIRPYYLNITLPGEPEPSFLILQPFVPVSQGNQQTRLVSYMVTNSDPGHYGEMTAFQMPEDPIVLGPVQIDNEINTTVEISEQLTLLSRGGSSVIQGSMQLIPIGDSILYVRPYYVEGTAESSYPQFRFVVVTAPGQDLDPVLDTSIQGGLNQLFDLGLPEPETGPDEPTEPDGTEPPPDEPVEPGSRTVQELLDDASQAFQDANAALRQGDLAEYERLINQAADLVDEARSPNGGTTPTTTAPETPGDA